MEFSNWISYGAMSCACLLYLSFCSNDKYKLAILLRVIVAAAMPYVLVVGLGLFAGLVRSLS